MTKYSDDRQMRFMLAQSGFSAEVIEQYMETSVYVPWTPDQPVKPKRKSHNGSWAWWVPVKALYFFCRKMRCAGVVGVGDLLCTTCRTQYSVLPSRGKVNMLVGILK